MVDLWHSTPGLARLLVLLVPGACGPTAAVEPSGSTGAAATGSTSTGAALSSTGVSTTGATTSVEPNTTGTALTTDGGDFVAPLDVAGESGECDPHAEMPCPEGQKCSAAAPEWSPSILYIGHPACYPILGDLQKGEPCDLGENPLDGLDDCAEGLICVDIHWLWGTKGVCTDFCDPAWDDSTNASCSDPMDFCYNPVCQECGLQVCVPACDPLVQDCPDGTACVLSWVNEADDKAFACEAVQLDFPGVGKSCNDYYRCSPGVQCVEREKVANPACTDPDTCCTPLCDLNAPNTCPGAAMGEVCNPFYPQPFDPVVDPWSVQYDRLGICTLP